MNGIVVIVASAGGLNPVRRIIAGLPPVSTAAVFVVMHIGNRRSVLPDLLETAGRIPAMFAQDGALIEPGHVYVAPPDQHVILDRNFIRLDHGPKVHHTRPAGDPLFISAAEAHGHRMMGIVLSGGGGDGAVGLRRIRECGGIAIVQHPDEAEAPSMPFAAIMADHPDACLPVQGVSERVNAFCLRSWDQSADPAHA